MDESTFNGNGNGTRSDEPAAEPESIVPTGNGAGAPEPEEPEAVFPESEPATEDVEPGPVEPGEEPAASADPEPEAESEPEPVEFPQPEEDEGPQITLEELLAAVQSDGGGGAAATEEVEAVAEPPAAAEAPVAAAETPSAAPDLAPAASAVAVEAPPEAGEAPPEAGEAPPEGEAEEEEALPEWVPGDWFVVHTYSGYENKVKTSLEMRVHSMNMEEKIFEIVVPMEDVMEVKSGKKQLVQRKVFPGYLLVRMDLDDDSWYVVRNTPGVTGFVGSGTKPIPLSTKEVDQILQRKGVEEKPKPKLEFSVSDAVRVVVGPFANFQGVISEIDTDRSKLKVLVNIFGRETPVELGFDQVSKI